MSFDVGRVRHLAEQMHRSEDDAGDPIDDGMLLASAGDTGMKWVDPDTIGATTLDGLSDVTITSAATDDTLSFNGSIWVNSSRRWEPVTDGEDVFVWESDDLVMEFKEY